MVTIAGNLSGKVLNRVCKKYAMCLSSGLVVIEGLVIEGLREASVVARGGLFPIRTSKIIIIIVNPKSSI